MEHDLLDAEGLEACPGLGVSEQPAPGEGDAEQRMKEPGVPDVHQEPADEEDPF
jgi:hypothetical protein